MERVAELRSKEPKKYWAALKRLRGGSKGFIKITADHSKKGRRLWKDIEIEEGMREVWKEKFVPPPQGIMHEDTERELEEFFEGSPDACIPYETADFSRLDPSCPYSRPIKPIDVYNTIYSFKNRAPGEDGITRMHLRHIPRIVLVNLAHIYSAALALGYYPDNIKRAIMVFIPKPGKPHCDPSNYRPISLLSVVGKIYGKILTLRLTIFLADKKLNHPHQYGFVQDRGTTHSLAMVYEYVARQKTGTYEKRVTLVSRDIKGAFDRLDHRRVKYHLYHTDTPPVLCKALSSFLDDRMSRIRIVGVTGPPFQLLAGSPQGAAPSAKLFTLVTRNAPVGKNIHYYNTHYADDCLQVVSTQGTNIQYHGKNI